MKTALQTVLLLLSLTVVAQSNTSESLLGVEWINNDLDYIRFHKDTLLYNIDGKKHVLHYDVNKDIVSFKEKYLEGGAIVKEESISFKIRNINDKKLILRPIEDKLTLDQESFYKLDYQPFFTKKEFVFYNKRDMLSKVDYKKITFHGSTCFGTCPSFSVEINRDGKVFYQGRIYTKDYTGDFEGNLGKEERIKLIKILNRSQLALIDQNWKQRSHVTDQPRYNYIVELSNGQIVEINTNDQHPILDQLSRYFINIPKKLKLQKTNKNHSYVQPSLKAHEIVYREEE